MEKKIKKESNRKGKKKKITMRLTYLITYVIEIGWYLFGCSLSSIRLLFISDLVSILFFSFSNKRRNFMKKERKLQNGWWVILLQKPTVNYKWKYKDKCVYICLFICIYMSVIYVCMYVCISFVIQHNLVLLM